MALTTLAGVIVVSALLATDLATQDEAGTQKNWTERRDAVVETLTQALTDKKKSTLR